MKNLFQFTIAFALLTHILIFSQDNEHASEIDSSIPELYEFHEVIYPIWHTAYPTKDISMLKEMVIDVNDGAEKIYSVQLPGILRDKQEEWNEGVTRFRSSVERYTEATEKSGEEMLSSAEELHSNYEMLVRIIKPVTKEVDEFHKVLYMIYHHYWPNKNIEEFNGAVDELVERAEELNTSELPKWFEDKTKVVKEQSQILYRSTNKLKELQNNNADESEIDKALEGVHNDYVALEALFND